ncbi:hypothetical protein EOM39_01105, partial [Candidatus Gracilibacteria bacterium]|nr:hypothetical protein [Candidatus Gracilibacteria bacterium]
MKKVLSIFLIILVLSGKNFADFETNERDILSIEGNLCQKIQEKDIPTILVPGILASWYSEEGYKETGKQVKRWIPDPINHTYDTLIYTFKQNGYKIKDVFYQDEFTLSTSSSGSKYIGRNPKNGLYVFGYDWKKDNKITATLLTQLIGLILRDYEYHNKCNIGKVNIVSHSMGGLVARAMLEDMCVEKGYQNGLMKIILRDDNNKITYFDSKKEMNGKIQNFDSYPCQNPYSSSNISKDIKVNKLITIATPHRGSPKAFAIWEKGDIEMTDGFMVGYFGIKNQLNVSSDLGLYKLIHGYDNKVPNGVVTLGQLLPDINNDNDYNNKKLKYLYKEKKEVTLDKTNKLNQFYDTEDNKYSDLIDSTNNFYSIKIENYPQNSFLEELNKKENIDKMMKKIEKKYISYYSKITGNNGLNNIFNIELGDKTEKYITIAGSRELITYDETYKHKGQDIYSYYIEDSGKNYYLISKVLRNQSGLGGDGTVPTNNLKLVPNDSTDGKEFSNSNFESREIKCNKSNPTNNNYKTIYSTDNEYNEPKLGIGSFSKGNIITNDISLNNELYPYIGFGEIDKYEVCSHTNMPFATSGKIIEDLLDLKDTEFNKRYGLLSNFGYADYTYEEKGIIIDENRGIKNNNILSWFYDKNRFNTKISDNILKKDNPINRIRFSLDLQTTDALFEYDILSPIDIMITDEQGRRIGIDRDTGMIVNEIPGAWTSGRAGESGEREFFLIPGKTGEPINHKIE